MTTNNNTMIIENGSQIKAVNTHQTVGNFKSMFVNVCGQQQISHNPELTTKHQIKTRTQKGFA